jgi:hypothetical protein
MTYLRAARLESLGYVNVAFSNNKAWTLNISPCKIKVSF